MIYVFPNNKISLKHSNISSKIFKSDKVLSSSSSFSLIFLIESKILLKILQVTLSSFLMLLS